MPLKNHYEVLGISRNASPKEIRDAYLIRGKMFHPDRFNQVTQPKEWEEANNLFKELNEANSILSNPSSRRQFDAAFFGSPVQEVQPQPSQARTAQTQRPTSTQETPKPVTPPDKRPFLTRYITGIHQEQLMWWHAFCVIALVFGFMMAATPNGTSLHGNRYDNHLMGILYMLTALRAFFGRSIYAWLAINIVLFPFWIPNAIYLYTRKSQLIKWDWLGLPLLIIFIIEFLFLVHILVFVFLIISSLALVFMGSCNVFQSILPIRPTKAFLRDYSRLALKVFGISVAGLIITSILERIFVV